MSKQIREKLEWLKSLTDKAEHWYRWQSPVWILMAVYIVYFSLGESMLHLSKHVLLPIVAPTIAFLFTGHEGWQYVAGLSVVGLIFVGCGLQLKKVGQNAKSQMDQRSAQLWPERPQTR